MAILRIRDESGKVYDIPALVGPPGPSGDGSGDMLKQIYDPNGKLQDVYLYTEEAVKAHNENEEAHADLRKALEDAETAVSDHNEDGEAHPDIRMLLEDAGVAFLAVYGETESAEIYAAFQAGKAVLCINGSRVYALNGCSEERAKFTCTDRDGFHSVEVQTGSWSSTDEAHAVSLLLKDGRLYQDDEDVTEAVLSALGAAPAYTISDQDLVAGESQLATGALYFVYE